MDAEHSSDVIEIQRLMYEYAHRFDAGDIAGFAALFENATLKLGALAPTANGSAAVRSMIDGMVIMYDGIPHTNHLMHNPIVDVDEDGLGATSRCYVQILQGLPDFPPQTIMTGIYHDRFVKGPEGWAFAERRATGSLIGDISRHLNVRLPPKS